MIDTKMTSRGYELEDENARFLQMIPVFISMAVMALSPFYAEKSLKIYRAIQAYKFQPIGERDYSEFEKKSFWKKYFTPISFIIFWTLNAIISLPSNTENLEKDWPTFSRFRNSIPFVLIVLATYFGFINILKPLIYEEVRVTGYPINEASKDSYAQFDTSIFSYADRKKSYDSLRIKSAIAAILLTVSSTFLRKDGNFVVLLITISSTLFVFRFLGNTFGLFEKVSLRLHFRRMMITLLILAAVLVIFAGIVFGLYFTMLFFFSTDEPIEEKTPEQKAAMAVSNVAEIQTICLIQVCFWSLFLFFPARLLNFAYRYDASKQGLTSISESTKLKAISESKQMTIPAKPIKDANHNLDCLGRTPININTQALQMKDAIEYKHSWNVSSSFPIFSTALKVILGLHLAFILIVTTFVRSDFNVPFFARTGDQVSFWLGHFLTINIMPIVSYFALLIIIPAAAAFSAKRNGQSIQSGLQQLWRFEEDWSIMYENNPMSQVVAEQVQEEATEMKQLFPVIS